MKVRPVALMLASLFAVAVVPAQEQLQVRVTPTSLQLGVGEKSKLTAEVVDAGGRPVDIPVFFFSLARRELPVGPDGAVEALAPGTYSVVARAATQEEPRPSTTIEVRVAYPELDRVEIVAPSGGIYAGTTVLWTARAIDASGLARRDPAITWRTSVPVIAEIDAFGQLSGRAPGHCVVTATVEGRSTTRDIEVLVNPVQSLELTTDVTALRTGDVLHFSAKAVDAAGHPVTSVPIHYALAARPADDLGPGATGQITQDGRFVAEEPGLYTLVAHCGAAVARTTVRVTQRQVQQKLELVGHGEVLDVHTSDLWVWQGVDGRDYAITGTWGAHGDALFWDVTDPAAMERIASVRVDARTVNDVKVSADGKVCVISREGASNRRNGIVILDVEDPSAPQIVSTFDQNLTGGVHNLFISEGHVYALSAARRYDVIDIRDVRSPHRVGTFELAAPDHSIHDVWIEDGLAYSSNWRHGVQIVDVGNGIAGGRPESPVAVGSYTYPSGWNHAAFPYRSAGTGKFYVIAGDEAFPYGLHLKDTPTYPRGWFHFIDFSDMSKPVEVARYQVPEAGTHNLWVEGDVLYGAYYNGGLRVVDISGELMGDLYRQGREIAWFLPTHKDGVIPNATMVWGPQPYKGNIFFSDWNTGLWAVRLVPQEGQ